MRTIIAIIAVFASSAAFAQTVHDGIAVPTTTVTATSAETSVKTTAVDPDSKMFCSQIETLGTRLGGHKVCMTRRQWREQAVENRMAVNRAQTERASDPLKGY